MWVDTLKRFHQIFTGQGFKVGVAYRPVFCAKQVAKRLTTSLDDKKLCLQPDHYYHHHYHYYYYYCCCYVFFYLPGTIR